MNYATSRGTAPRLATPTDLGANATKDIAGALNGILADIFALYLKTKNFHWHISGPHFRDYHLLLDEQADQIFAMTDADRRARPQDRRHNAALDRRHLPQAAHARTTTPSYVEPHDMLAELREDNKTLVAAMREAHDVCDEHNDVATASLLENFIDEPSGARGSCYEASRKGDPTGH